MAPADQQVFEDGGLLIEQDGNPVFAQANFNLSSYKKYKNAVVILKLGFPLNIKVFQKILYESGPPSSL